MPPNKFAVLAPPIISGVFAVLAAGVSVWGAMEVTKAKDDTTKAKNEAENAVKGIRVPIGTIVAFAGSKEDVPTEEGWMLCDGRTLPASGYKELESILRSRFGGEARIPDFRGRGPIGAGKGEGTDGQGKPLSDRLLGEALGAEKHMLIKNEMPRHRHSAKQPESMGHFPGEKGRRYIWGGTGTDNDLTGEGGGHSELAWGESVPHNNMQPSLAVNFIIKAK
ncbi:Tail fiber protein [Sulfidibacter corallicola]|uniref:Tail fiber protein n=1 Tax=Sulfidibacter corallicola TaxID=2818388 RepID=A0A8A4TG19_SULCO|nr:tail fiber protein [Sulfidibacter corallicola]QTD48583.1 tail fiber protein [Sulfidibacter corallicola]